MRTDKIKKFVLPNIPYLFIAWACLKVGTAYRLAAGADFAHKLVGMVAALGPAFAESTAGMRNTAVPVGAGQKTSSRSPTPSLKTTSF